MKSIQRTAVLTLVLVLLCATALATPRGPVCWWCGSRDTEWADYTHFFESTHSHHYYCHNPNCILNTTWGGAKGDEPEPCSFTIPADCTKGASCVCGNTSGGPVHAEIIDTAVAPACTETGLTEGSHCSLCDAVLVAQQIVPETGHTVVTDPAIPMTCAEDGKTEGAHCSVCGAVLAAQETLPATGHTASVDAAVAPTCIGTGLTEGSHCSVCDTVLAAQETLPAAGHTLSVDAAVAPTCTRTGMTEGSHCATCAEVLVARQAVPATGHTVSVDAVIASTCTETGLTEGSHCSVCREVLVERQTVPATGHTVSVDAAVAPTCTRTGLTEESHCATCAEVLVARQAVPATGHTITIDAAVAPTCIGTGLTEGSHCATCAEVLVARQALPAIAHQYLVTVTPPTCAADGYSAYTCAQCSSTYTADVIARKGHVNGAWINTGNDTHSSACKRASCGHVRTGSCEYTEVTLNGQQMNICAVCGAMRINAAKNSKAIETALPPIPGAAAEPVGGGLLPRGRLIVYGQENPFDGVLHALSVAFEYAGQISELSGPVRVYVPFESASAFKLYRIAGEMLTDIPFTYEDGVISFQIDQAGLFLLAADGASFSLPSA